MQNGNTAKGFTNGRVVKLWDMTTLATRKILLLVEDETGVYFHYKEFDIDTGRMFFESKESFIAEYMRNWGIEVLE